MTPKLYDTIEFGIDDKGAGPSLELGALIEFLRQDTLDGQTIEQGSALELAERVQELETKAADLQSQRQIEHWSLEQAYENVKKLSLQLNAAEDRVKFTSAASDGVCQVYANRINELETKAAEVVAELRRRSSECEPPGDVYGEEANFQSGRSDAFDASAEAVESMLGLARCGEGCDGNCELTAYGPTKAEAEVAELRSKAAEIVAELRAEVIDLSRHNRNEYIRDRSEALTRAADLITEKLGLK